MANGFMGKLLRVDLTKGVITEEDTRQDWAKKYYGGAGLATRYYYDEVPVGIDPLGPENVLIFMTGPLTGTASASASRYSVVAKSPQTGIWAQSNSGGSFGPALKRSGFDGVILTGISPTPVYLEIMDGKAKLLDATALWGKKVPDTEDTLQETYGKKINVASIGPAGENLVRYSAIMNDKHRAAGRCGMGTVMGSKRLKAIVCSGNASVALANKENFKAVAKNHIDLLDESILKVAFEAFGTNLISDSVNARGGYPTNNWKEGVFEEIDEVGGQALTDKVLEERVKCFACPIACGRGTKIKEGKWKGKSGEGPEYETANTLGAMCGVSDMNAITMANYHCNEYGMDTISAGSTIAFAIECFEKGILTTEETGGIELKFNDPEMVVDLVEKIAKREGIGDLLAEGTLVMSQKLGKGSEHFAMQVKGLELPAYDPRAAKIVGVSYVTANRGGDHTTGYMPGPTFIDLPFLLVEDSFIKDPFEANPEETKIVIELENALTIFDSIGACKFMGILMPAEEYVELINHATGWTEDALSFRKTGERIFNLMRACCLREGFDRKDDMLPKRLLEDPLPSGPAEGQVLDLETLEMMKDAYYAFRNWDKATGKPTKEKLTDLGLEYLTSDLWER
jgi:aldehyde:ferredoxin oxidoreductase